VKLYVVQYEAVDKDYAGTSSEWFARKSDALRRGKSLASKVDVMEGVEFHIGDDWSEKQNQVYGVYMVDVPTNKKGLISWLAESNAGAARGLEIWGPS
jgi:hypothetical protein